MLLEAKNLKKKYQRGKKDFYAVNDVNLQIDEGDFIQIVGKSGSGKSTLLNLLTGLLTPDEGEIILKNRRYQNLTDTESSFLRNTEIGYIPQGYSALSNLTVIDNVWIPHFLYQREGDAVERANELLEQFQIANLAGEYPKFLSGGELKRVSIARALLNRPSILIADEPTSDLDMETTKEIMLLFQNIAEQGIAVVMVTHELDTLSYGKSAFVMENGKLSPKDLIFS